jgi:hypothetical protein
MLLAVNGTLMRGLELNGNLVAAGATFVRETRTAPAYRLWSIADRHPAMLRVHENGAKVAVEIWDVPAPGIAEILAKEPTGLSIGKVMLEDGTEVLGVLGEPILVEGQREITHHGGWRAYTATRQDMDLTAHGRQMTAASSVNDLTTIASYVDHAAPLMGLTLTPEQREGVIKNLAMTFEVAQLVMEFPLPDEVDAAPVFEA